MLDIIILAVGSIKESHYRDAFGEYAKRLSPYARLKVIELAPESFRKESDKQKCQRAEAARIMAQLEKYPPEAVWLLDEQGDELDSQVWAKELGKMKQSVLVIGGTLGLSPELKKSKYRKISLSQLTLPHELARVVVLEQLYRAATIINKKAYHY